MALPRFHDFSDRPMMLKDFLLAQDCTQYPCKSTHSSKSVSLLRSWSKRAAATKVSAFQKLINAVKALQGNSRKLVEKGISGGVIMSENKLKVKDILRMRSFRDTAEDDDESTPLRNITRVDWPIEECEQQSPVSVLDVSPFPPSLVGARCMLTQELEANTSKSRSFSCTIAFSKGPDAIEEKADDHVNMIYYFFARKLSLNGNTHDGFEFDNEILRVAKSWCNEENDDESYDCDVMDKEAYVKGMEKGACWSKFELEHEEMSIEFEIELLDELIDEVLIHYTCLSIL